MSAESGRNTAGKPFKVADGWTIKRVTPASRLAGANGLRTGADGRIYVAQVSASTISAIDVATGAVEAISPMGSEIVGPDDLVFDDAGNLYATEITMGRVSMRAPNGTYRVIYDQIPIANPITWHQGQLIAGELRMGGRIMQLDLNGGAPRIIASDIPMSNAFDVGPDGKLYFPAQAANEIWRVGLDGSKPEVVAKDLGVPDSVKFHPDGYIVSTQVVSGEVLKIDPRTGDRSVLANLTPGLDNVTFVGKRTFVSSITGFVKEILDGGKTRDLVSEGYMWPMGLAVSDEGWVFVADGPFCYQVTPGESGRKILGMLFHPGYPGYARGVAKSGPGEFIVTSANGVVASYRPAKSESTVLASGYGQLYGVAVSPRGAVIFTEQDTGRVLSIQSGNVETIASGLKLPSGVAVAPDGTCYVAESGGGRIVKVVGGKAETALDGLQQPQGVLVHDGKLYVVDARAKELVSFDLSNKKRTTIVSNLPVGAPPGVTPKFLGAIGDMSGPMGPFAAIAAAPDGTLYISGDAEGSVLAVRPA